MNLHCEYFSSYNETALRGLLLFVIHFIVHRITYASNLACFYSFISLRILCTIKGEEKHGVNAEKRKRAPQMGVEQEKLTCEPNKDKIYFYCLGTGAFQSYRMRTVVPNRLWCVCTIETNSCVAKIWGLRKLNGINGSAKVLHLNVSICSSSSSLPPTHFWSFLNCVCVCADVARA